MIPGLDLRIFPHPYRSDDPLELSVCDFCGAPADKAIHDRRHAARSDLWGGKLWWPHERHNDGGGACES